MVVLSRKHAQREFGDVVVPRPEDAEDVQQGGYGTDRVGAAAEPEQEQ